MNPVPLTRADRLSGSFLGLALGDALGFVVEAAPAEIARVYARDELGPGYQGSRGHPNFPFGQYSDDTQLARALLLAVRDAGHWHAPAFAARVAELFRDGQPVGAGPGTRAAAERLMSGHIWSEAGTPPPYAGNGGAMRVAPLGILLAGDLARLVEAAAEQCRVTHQEERCAAGAVAVAGAASLASRPGTLDPGRLCGELAEIVEDLNREVADVVHQVASWVPLPPDAALERFRCARLDPTERGPWRGVSTHVVPSVAWSLYAALHSPDDYWTAVRTAIAPGGDTDTMAAMAGGIVGGRVGKAGLPGGLLGLLTDRGRWPADELERLAIDCSVCT